jgi:hypothetical protein
MLTLFMLLAAAGGILRLALAWLLKQRWGVSIGVPQALAGALVVLAGLPEFIKPIPFPVPLGPDHWPAASRPFAEKRLI